MADAVRTSPFPPVVVVVFDSPRTLAAICFWCTPFRHVVLLLFFVVARFLKAFFFFPPKGPLNVWARPINRFIGGTFAQFARACRPAFPSSAGAKYSPGPTFFLPSTKCGRLLHSLPFIWRLSPDLSFFPFGVLSVIENPTCLRFFHSCPCRSLMELLSFALRPSFALPCCFLCGQTRFSGVLTRLSIFLVFFLICTSRRRVFPALWKWAEHSASNFWIKRG